MASRLWKFLTPGVCNPASLDSLKSSVDTAKAVLGLAEALQEDGQQLQRLAPLVSRLDSLLDVLNSPLGRIAGAGLPFVSIGTGLLKCYLETTKREPTVAQSVALVSQAAYLKALIAFLAKPELQTWLVRVGDRPASATVTQKLQRLRNFELGDTEARRALLYFHESKLAVAYGEVLITRLVELGIKPNQASKLANKLARDTNRLMLPTLVQTNDSVKALIKWCRAGGAEVFEKYLSIDTYLEEWIAPRPYERVFAESFSFKDIYVPLQARPLTAAGEPDRGQDPVVLEQWVQQQLNDNTQKDRVLFVQGGPGRGKSMFCRMFADWVHRHEHPRWTPILIRLRDVTVLSRDFEETLAKAVDRDFTKTDSGWLTDRNVNFLFLLDGFDELLLEGRTSGGLDHFLDQVGRFQEQCARNSEKGHRVLITGRTLALQAIESRLPSNLCRIEILPLDDTLQHQWLTRWGELMGQKPPQLINFLQDERLPERVRELAREPLLLYLLAAMHRDGKLQLQLFDGANGAKAKVLIYERTLDWVLTKQRAEGYRRSALSPDIRVERNLNPDITELEAHHLRRILQEAGLCVVQSGMEFARIQSIEVRLSQDSAARAFLEAAQKRLNTDDSPLRNALASFYLREGHQETGSVEFVHKSFGEFLCAERIVSSLIDSCQPGRNREYDSEEAAFCWTLYDLLGGYALTPEIVEYLTALLIKHPDFDPGRLHRRLYDFYWRWSDGEFIDAPPENLPQQKMRLLRQKLPQGKRALGLQQVNMTTGLNVMILLLELHRYGYFQGSETNPSAQADTPVENPFSFHPCGHSADDKRIGNSRLLKIISLSHCLGIVAFTRHIGPFLSHTDLNRADLSHVNIKRVELSHANLSHANLSHANLSHANLSHANLSRASLSRASLSRASLSYVNLNHADICDANFIGTSLSHADFEHADLSRASLISADLSCADLMGANLCNADLRDADLCGANFEGAILGDQYGEITWNKQTQWTGARGLDRAIGVPEALKHQLGLNSTEPYEIDELKRSEESDEIQK